MFTPIDAYSVNRLPGCMFEIICARALSISLLTQPQYVLYDHTIHTRHLGRSGVLMPSTDTLVHTLVTHLNLKCMTWSCSCKPLRLVVISPYCAAADGFSARGAEPMRPKCTPRSVTLRGGCRPVDLETLCAFHCVHLPVVLLLSTGSLDHWAHSASKRVVSGAAGGPEASSPCHVRHYLNATCGLNMSRVLE